MEDKRSRGKLSAASTTNTPTGFICSAYSRDCRSQIGLYSHTRRYSSTTTVEEGGGEVLINSFGHQGERLFEVGVFSRLGAYSVVFTIIHVCSGYMLFKIRVGRSVLFFAIILFV